MKDQIRQTIMNRIESDYFEPVTIKEIMAAVNKDLMFAEREEMRKKL